MKTSMIILKMRTKKRINNRKVAFCDQEEKSNKELRETGASFSVRVPGIQRTGEKTGSAKKTISADVQILIEKNNRYVAESAVWRQKQDRRLPDLKGIIPEKHRFP